MIETLHIDGLTVLHAPPAPPTAAGARPAGEPVLFVHGYFADARVWLEWLRFFAERGVPAYAVHLRGRGGSRPDADLGRASVADFADDAATVARFLGRPAVIGHSMGGLIAQRLAERDLVRAAVLVTPAPPRGIPLLNARLTLAQLKYLPRILASRIIDPDLDDLRALAFNCVPPDIQELALVGMVPDSGRAGREMGIIGVPIDRDRVRCPLLVVAAAEDHFVPPAVVARVARRYGAELETVPGHGHMVILEPGWAALAERVARWLARTAPAHEAGAAS